MEKDSDRPHYYSQFWLDVASGRKVIGLSKTNEEGEPIEEMPEPIPPYKSNYHHVASSTDGHRGIQVQARIPVVVEPTFVPDEVVEPEPELEEAELPVDEDAVDFSGLLEDEPDLLETDIPDMDLTTVEPSEEEKEKPVVDFIADEVEEDEEEEDIDWPARGRKKPKPGRQVKPPAKKPSKRDTRRF